MSRTKLHWPMCEVLTRGHALMAQAPKGATACHIEKMQGTGPKGGHNLPGKGWEGGEQPVMKWVVLPLCAPSLV